MSYFKDLVQKTLKTAVGKFFLPHFGLNKSTIKSSFEELYFPFYNSTNTIRLFALDFFEVIVDSASIGQINYHLIEFESE